MVAMVAYLVCLLVRIAIKTSTFRPRWHLRHFEGLGKNLTHIEGHKAVTPAVFQALIQAHDALVGFD